MQTSKRDNLKNDILTHRVKRLENNVLFSSKNQNNCDSSYFFRRMLDAKDTSFIGGIFSQDLTLSSSGWIPIVTLTICVFLDLPTIHKILAK